MQLPGADNAVVPRGKLLEYLLSASHPVGRHKATFFRAYGFTPDRWQALVDALVRHANANPVAHTEETPFGTKYTVEGPLESPDGRDPAVRGIWFVSPRGAPRG
jgi:hypothetical protein